MCRSQAMRRQLLYGISQISTMKKKKKRNRWKEKQHKHKVSTIEGCHSNQTTIIVTNTVVMVSLALLRNMFLIQVGFIADHEKEQWTTVLFLGERYDIVFSTGANKSSSTSHALPFLSSQPLFTPRKTQKAAD